MGPITCVLLANELTPLALAGAAAKLLSVHCNYGLEV